MAKMFQNRNLANSSLPLHFSPPTEDIPVSSSSSPESFLVPPLSPFPFLQSAGEKRRGDIGANKKAKPNTKQDKKESGNGELLRTAHTESNFEECVSPHFAHTSKVYFVFLPLYNLSNENMLSHCCVVKILDESTIYGGLPLSLHTHPLKNQFPDNNSKKRRRKEKRCGEREREGWRQKEKSPIPPANTSCIFLTVWVHTQRENPYIGNVKKNRKYIPPQSGILLALLQTRYRLCLPFCTFEINRNFGKSASQRGALKPESPLCSSNFLAFRQT